MAHEHTVNDSDRYFIINTATRKITNKSGKVVLMQNDHNSERFTFELPKTVEGHDMSKCNQVQIHYQNKEAVTNTVFEDVYEVSDFVVSTSDPTKVNFSWLISGNATQYVGELNFSIRFACVAGDGTIEYAWNTAAYYGIMVSPCFHNSEAVATAYSDILAQWHKDLYLASIGNGVSTEEAREILGVVAANVIKVTLSAAGWSNGLQTVSVEGVKADPAACHVFATYAPENYAEYRDCEVRVVEQGDGTLTFACNTDFVPANDIAANIAIYV